VTFEAQVDCITLSLIERQQLTSSSSTKTHEKVIYQTKVIFYLTPSSTPPVPTLFFEFSLCLFA
jgi:hypothetical protein